jgi:hypothetical protein
MILDTFRSEYFDEDDYVLKSPLLQAQLPRNTPSLEPGLSFPQIWMEQDIEDAPLVVYIRLP